MEYNKIIKKQSYIIISSLIVVVLLLIGFSYALFVQNNSSKDNQVIVAGDLNVKFDDNSGTITANMTPKSDAEALLEEDNVYTFTIKNNGTLNASYIITLQNDPTLVEDENNLLAHRYLRLSIDGADPFTLASATKLDENETAENEIIYIISANNKIKANKSKNHSVRVWLDEDAPTSVIGKNISLKIGIKSDIATAWDDLCENDSTLLNCRILEAHSGKTAIINKGTPDTTTIAATDEGLFATGDSLGHTYYYRGAVTDNYVLFGGYYWRITRLNGNGSIRLIYQGTEGNKTATGGSAYQTPSTTLCQIGYQCDGTNSTIKAQIENWFAGLSKYNSDIATSTFVNDTAIELTNETATTYAPNARLNNLKPSLLNSTTEANYGGNYKLKIGLITMDEVIYAGGGIENNADYYLNMGGSYWTMTPYEFASGVNTGIIVNGSGKITTANITATNDVRPVISLNDETKYKCTSEEACGTIANPFVIEN